MMAEQDAKTSITKHAVNAMTGKTATVMHGLIAIALIGVVGFGNVPPDNLKSLLAFVVGWGVLLYGGNIAKRN